MSLGCCGKRRPKDRRVYHILLDGTDGQWDWRTVEMGWQLNNYNTVCNGLNLTNTLSNIMTLQTWTKCTHISECLHVRELKFNEGSVTKNIVGQMPTASGCIKRLTIKTSVFKTCFIVIIVTSCLFRPSWKFLVWKSILLFRCWEKQKRLLSLLLPMCVYTYRLLVFLSETGHC